MKNKSGKNAVAPLSIKRKKKRIIDRTYHPKQKRKSGHQVHPLHFGASTYTTVTNTAGVEEPLRTSILIDRTKITSEMPVPKDLWLDNFAQVPSFTPISEIIEVSMNGSPLKVRDQTGKELSLAASIGVGFIYSNEPPQSPSSIKNPLKTMNANIPPEFYNSSPVLALRPPPEGDQRSEEITITPALLEQHNHPRSSTQSQVIANPDVKGSVRKASATNYAQRTGLFDEKTRFHFSHVKPYKTGGEETQRYTNYTILTDNANYRIRDFEHAAYNETKNGPVILKPRSNLFPNTYLSRDFSTTLQTANYSVEFSVNPHLTKPPHIHDNLYVRAITKTLTMANTKENTPPRAPTKKRANSCVFYKEKIADNEMDTTLPHKNVAKKLCF